MTEPWYGKNADEGLSLDAAENAAVERVWRRARAAQPRFDQVMTSICDGTAEHGAQQEGLEYSLKTLDSFRGKVARKKGQLPAEQAAEETNDLNRYTLTYPPDQYTDGTLSAFEALEQHGFERTRCANTWDKNPYKGVNTTWRHRESGQTMEVQFHTPESRQVKESNHLLYEIERSGQGLTPEEADAITVLQARRYEGITVPPGHERISPPLTPDDVGVVSDEAIHRMIAREERLRQQKAEAKEGAQAEGEVAPASDRNPTGPAPPSAGGPEEDITDDAPRPGADDRIGDRDGAAEPDLTEASEAESEPDLRQEDQPGPKAEEQQGGVGEPKSAAETEPVEEPEPATDAETAADEPTTTTEPAEEPAPAPTTETETAADEPATAEERATDTAPAAEQEPAPEEPAPEQPEPATQEPATEEPTPEQPEPAAEQEPTEQEPAPEQPEPATEEPAAETEPAVEEPAPEPQEPATGEPAPEEPATETEPAPEQPAPEQSSYEDHAAADDARVADSMGSESDGYDSGGYDPGGYEPEASSGMERD